MMPRDADAYKAALLRWACGHQPAAEFLDLIARAARLADNLVDGDSDSPAEHMGQLLHMLMVELPSNAFYAQNFHALKAPVTESIVNWVASEAWRKSRDEKQQMFAFVLRESTDRIGVAVAGLVGGYTAARAAMDDIYQSTEAGKAETFADWRQET